MSLIDRLKRAIPYVGGSRTHLECRRCGITLTAASDTCPSCNSREIARYRLDSPTRE